MVIAVLILLSAWVSRRLAKESTCSSLQMVVAGPAELLMRPPNIGVEIIEIGVERSDSEPLIQMPGAGNVESNLLKIGTRSISRHPA